MGNLLAIYNELIIWQHLRLNSSSEIKWKIWKLFECQKRTFKCMSIYIPTDNFYPKRILPPPPLSLSLSLGVTHQTFIVVKIHWAIFMIYANVTHDRAKTIICGVFTRVYWPLNTFSNLTLCIYTSTQVNPYLDIKPSQYGTNRSKPTTIFSYL